MSGPLGLWALVLLPTAVGAALCLLGRRADRAAPGAAVTTSALLVALAVAAAAVRPAVAVPFVARGPWALEVDALAAVVLVLVAAVSLLVLVAAAAEGMAPAARFHGLMLLFVAAVTVTVVAASLPTLLLGWEVMGATSYALIGFHWREPHRVSAGTTAFLTTRAADLGLYLAAGAALAGGGSLVLADLPGASSGWRQVAAAGILLAALGKAAQLPFSFWLSRAMAGPSPVSALLHSAAMVAMGGYLLLRVEPLLAAVPWVASTAAWVGAATAVLLGLVALAQTDVKQVLAASTAAQLGLVVLAAGVGAVAGGTAHLVAHAATKSLLFLAAGAWSAAVGTTALAGLGGVARRWPVVGAAAVVGLLTLAGLPPLSLWATKDAVLTAALEHSVALYVAGLVATGLSAAYAGRVLLLVLSPAPSPDPRGSQQASGRVSRLEQVPLVVLAAGAAVGAVLLVPGVREVLPAGETFGVGGVELVVSAVLVVGVLVALAVRGGLPQPRWAAGFLGLQTATDAVVVAPVLRSATALARFDDAVLDRVVRAVGPRTIALSDVVRAADTGRVDAGVRRLAAEVRRLGSAARRPQTGQLHDYYVQAVAVLAAAALLLVVVR